VTGQDATALIHQAMPLCATLGVRAEKYAADEVALVLDWSPSLCTTGGILHGGAIMSLADSAGAACAFLNLPKDATGTSTIESKTNFLGAVRAGSVTATATPLHAGGTTIIIETAVRESSGRLVAKVTQTQMVLRPRG
jgi:1,4-dihydroxy-2-naphthoyl-CoA hydrolase